MERPNTWPMSDSYWYHQAHAPIAEQDSVEGHSVRAMYLLTAVADLFRLDSSKKISDTQYRQALDRLWHNMVDKKMYLTGGIGAMKQWEGFGIDYFLPQGTEDGGCYSETCASIGVMMLAERLLQLDLDGKYADVMELCMYNAVLTAMSENGTSFTYVNQLASSDEDLSKREEWFECACCPPNMTRTMGILGGYIWTHGVDGAGSGIFINVHQYATATLKFTTDKGDVELTQETNWPWSGNVKFALKTSAPVDASLRLRIPAWAKGFKVFNFQLLLAYKQNVSVANKSEQITPELPETKVSKGYLYLTSSYLAKHPTFKLEVQGFTPRLLRPHPYCNQDIVAIARGPIVYCVEDIDNPWVTNHFKDVAIDTSVPLKEIDKLGSKEGYVAISAPGAGVAIESSSWNVLSQDTDDKKTNGEAEKGRKDLTFIPYYARANRGGKGQMRVGLRVAR